MQAEKEIAGTEIQLMRMGEPGVPTAEEYCGKVLPEGVDQLLLANPNINDVMVVQP